MKKMKLTFTILFAILYGGIAVHASSTDGLTTQANQPALTRNIANFIQELNNVKEKNVVLLMQEAAFAVPLGFTGDGKTFFGVSYNSNQSILNFVEQKSYRYFSSSLEQGRLNAVKYFNETGSETNGKHSGKFLLSAKAKDGSSDLFIVEMKDGAIQQPVNLPFNTGSEEIFGSFSPDGQKIYFASNRPGGFGGFDIYETEYVGNNKWSTPRNLGDGINTSGDEICPFLLNDGLTLYYSTRPIQTGANFDIQYSTMDDMGNWYEPEKLESPINSEKDDLFYRVSPDNSRAVYFTSDNKGTGLYEIVFN